MKKVEDVWICIHCRDSYGDCKFAYAKKSAALEIASRKKGLQVYPCPFSSGWHVTSRER